MQFCNVFCYISFHKLYWILSNRLMYWSLILLVILGKWFYHNFSGSWGSNAVWKHFTYWTWIGQVTDGTQYKVILITYRSILEHTIHFVRICLWHNTLSAKRLFNLLIWNHLNLHGHCGLDFDLATGHDPILNFLQSCQEFWSKGSPVSDWKLICD